VIPWDSVLKYRDHSSWRPESIGAAWQAAVTKTLAHDWNVTGGAAVFQRPGRRDPRTALVDMLMLGMSNETGARLALALTLTLTLTFNRRIRETHRCQHTAAELLLTTRHRCL